MNDYGKEQRILATALAGILLCIPLWTTTLGMASSARDAAQAELEIVPETAVHEINAPHAVMRPHGLGQALRRSLKRLFVPCVHRLISERFGQRHSLKIDAPRRGV